MGRADSMTSGTSRVDRPGQAWAGIGEKNCGWCSLSVYTTEGTIGGAEAGSGRLADQGRAGPLRVEVWGVPCDAGAVGAVEV